MMLVRMTPVGFPVVTSMLSCADHVVMSPLTIVHPFKFLPLKRERNEGSLLAQAEKHKQNKHTMDKCKKRRINDLWMFENII
jgi:hypothetical protein